MEGVPDVAQSIVGASLLAKAVYQVAHSLAAKPSSRAGSLPQDESAFLEDCVNPAFPASDTRTCQGPAAASAGRVRRGRSCAARR
ncbi:hypothetical protein C1X64_12125 [Pseudomonas sp. GW456-E7]|nr:hypothetical protein C1X64_12125 [Pseudomonas sp. GW456-E7]